MTDHVCIVVPESYLCVECQADTREPFGPWNIPLPGYMPVDEWQSKQ